MSGREHLAGCAVPQRQAGLPQGALCQAGQGPSPALRRPGCRQVIVATLALTCGPCTGSPGCSRTLRRAEVWSSLANLCRAGTSGRAARTGSAGASAACPAVLVRPLPTAAGSTPRAGASSRSFATRKKGGLLFLADLQPAFPLMTEGFRVPVTVHSHGLACLSQGAGHAVHVSGERGWF